MLRKIVLVVVITLTGMQFAMCNPVSRQEPVSVSRATEQVQAIPSSPEGPGTWTTFAMKDGFLGSDIVYDIAQDGNGNLWFGTYDGGISRYDGTSWQTFTASDGLPDNSVRSIMTDDKGNIWAGTDGGIGYFDGNEWDAFPIKKGLGGQNVGAAFRDGRGDLWFSTNSGPIGDKPPVDYGVSRFNGKDWQLFTSKTTLGGLDSDRVHTIAQDRLGSIWFGTSAGATRYDGQSWRTFTTKDGLAGNLVSEITPDANGNLWFGTLGEGVSYYDGWKWRNFTVADGLANGFITAILPDSRGYVWVGTGGGVSRYDGASWQNFTTDDGLAEDEVHSIFEDNRGNIWFGTFSKGVSRWEPGQ